MNWFRFYHEALHDRKLRRLPPSYRWVWVAVLAMASESPTRGLLLIAENVPGTFDDIVDTAAVDAGEVQKALNIFMQQNMMTRTDEGVYAVVHWNKRQFASDNTTERTRGFRERSGNGDGNVSGTHQNTENRIQRSDTDTEEDHTDPPSPTKGKDNTPTVEAMDASAPSRAQARTKKTTSSQPENVTPLPTERARNPIWDALVDIFGYAPSTKPERSNWGKCVKELNGVNATPEDMKVRAARYIARFGRDRLTVNALVSHWSEFASDSPRGTASPPSQPRAMAANGGYYPRTRAPEPEPYYEPYDAVKHSPWNSTPSEPSPLLARMRKVAPITAESE